MQATFDPFDHEAFSRGWWEGLFDHAPTPDWGRRFKAWAVADRLMERYYVEVGLQAILGWDASDALGVHLASPGCVQAPRYFGHCDGIGVSTTPDLAGLVNIGLDGVEVVPACIPDFDPDQPEGYFKLERSGHIFFDEIEALGLDYEGESGHERCLHRVATSPAHLMLRCALLARLYRWSMDDFDRGFIASLPSAEALKQLLSQKVALRSERADFGWLADVQACDPRAPGAPWAYVVFPSPIEGLRIFRFDGVLEGGEFFDGSNLLTPWRQCYDHEYIVRQYAFEHYLM